MMHWVSQVIKDCIGFASPHNVNSVEISHHPPVLQTQGFSKLSLGQKIWKWLPTVKLLSTLWGNGFLNLDLTSQD